MGRTKKPPMVWQDYHDEGAFRNTWVSQAVREAEDAAFSQSAAANEAKREEFLAAEDKDLEPGSIHQVEDKTTSDNENAQEDNVDPDLDSLAIIPSTSALKQSASSSTLSTLSSSLFRDDVDMNLEDETAVDNATNEVLDTDTNKAVAETPLIRGTRCHRCDEKHVKCGNTQPCKSCEKAKAECIRPPKFFAIRATGNTGYSLNQEGK